MNHLVDLFGNILTPHQTVLYSRYGDPGLKIGKVLGVYLCYQSIAVSNGFGLTWDSWLFVHAPNCVLIVDEPES